jgi:glyoxylase-like metal-dependent hydrolase (beta-lactamase superfamily II)
VAETSAARLRAEPGVAARRLRELDEEDYVQRPRPLSLGNVQALPVPGRLDVGDQVLELLPADGHTHDGMAIWVGWAKVLIAGDYLSPLELPWLAEQGSRSAYLATLGRLKPYVEQAALAIMREDVAYLQGLPDDAPLPIARRDRRQRGIHAENVARVRAGAT